MNPRSIAAAAAGCLLTAVVAAPAAHAAAPPQTNDGRFHNSAPTRLLDTRQTGGKIAAGGERSVQITGVAGVPTTGVKAAVVNITAIDTTAQGWVTAYASGTTRPWVSAVNFQAGWTGATTATVPVGADGKITLYLGKSAANLAVDLIGYYSTDADAGPVGSLVTFTDGLRLADTRTDGGPVGGGKTLDVEASWDVGQTVPTAVAVNITAVSPQGRGWLTAWDGGANFPPTSTVNFTAGRTTANYTVVPVRALGNNKYAISVRNGSAMPTDVLVDVLGVYYTDPDGQGFVYNSVDPVRVLDTRAAIGAPKAKVGADTTLQFAPPASLYTPYTLGFSGTITGVSPSANTYISQSSGFAADPGTSNLNLVAGQNQSNGFSTPSWHNPANGQRTLSIYNQAGSLDIVEDVSGRYDASAQVVAGGSSAMKKLNQYRFTAPSAHVAR